MQNMKKNEKAVSPVLGVILMVAITVIVAAVVAAFIFGIGAPAKAPQASLAAKVSASGGLSLEHQGGDNLVLANSKVTFNPDIYGGGSNWAPVGTSMGDTGSWVYSSGTGNVTTLNPGDVATAASSVGTVGATAEVKVIDIPTGKLVLDSKVVITA